jgi:hypothetical protein
MDENFDYNKFLQDIIEDSKYIGYNDYYGALPKLGCGKHIIFKREKKIKNKREVLPRYIDIILSIESDKPFRIICSDFYITPWIKSTKKYKMTIPILCLPYSKISIEAKSDKVILESILLIVKERHLLARSYFIINTYFDKFIINSGYLINLSKNNIWNCKKSHLKKSEEYQRLYKSLSENNKLSPDIINLIIEQQYVIVDPGICTCSST